MNTDLRSRISKLESLLEHLDGRPGPSTANALTSPADDRIPKKNADPSATQKYIGSAFWSSLTYEMQALKEALEDEQPEEEETSSHSESYARSQLPTYELLLCPPGNVYVMPGVLQEPSDYQSKTLCHVFCQNVDRIFKVYHTQTLQAFLNDGKDYLGHDALSPGNKAVKAAIWFAATSTLSQSQCQALFQRPKDEQVSQFRKLAEFTLSQADLFTTTDLATLQALATFIMTSRFSDSSRRMWTMTAILVRIARAMGLQHEIVRRTPLETEIRRRLWHNIRWLDVFSAWDRGSAELLVGMGSFDTPHARNVEDFDFDEHSTSIPEEKLGVTGMTLATIMVEAIRYTHQFTSPESNIHDGDTWQDRLRMVNAFEEVIKERFIKHTDQSDPFHRLIVAAFQSMITAQRLRAVRPLRKHSSSTAPRVDDPCILQLASEALRAAEMPFEDPELDQFRWLAWVPWHPLATALAGLCTIRDTKLAGEAWSNVEKAYNRQARVIADSQRGLLWRPIEKLHKRARAFREHREETPSSTSSPLAYRQQPPTAPDTSALYGSTFQVHAAMTNLPQQSVQQQSQQFTTTVVPRSDVLLEATDATFRDSLMQDFDLSNTDTDWWMDYQNILDDISMAASDVNMVNIPWLDNAKYGIPGERLHVADVPDPFNMKEMNM